MESSFKQLWVPVKIKGSVECKMGIKVNIWCLRHKHLILKVLEILLLYEYKTAPAKKKKKIYIYMLMCAHSERP